MPVPRITKEDLKQRLDSGTPPILVDARIKYPYEHSTVKLPGAVRVGDNASASPFPLDREIVVYDSDPNELASSDVAAELIRRGYRRSRSRVASPNGWTRRCPRKRKKRPNRRPLNLAH